MLADKHDVESVLITFEQHPRKVLYPDTAGKDLRAYLLIVIIYCRRIID